MSSFPRSSPARAALVVTSTVMTLAVTSARAADGGATTPRSGVIHIDATSARTLELLPAGSVAAADGAADASFCDLVTAAPHGAAVDEGTLIPAAFFNSATLGGGHVVFQAAIDGSSRNQGIFRAADGVVTPIAIGCGGGGGSGDVGDGSGDPTPIGGTFAGFFGGTFYVPATNANGDVLFLADVDGGSASRGLFLARHDGAIDVVATVGGSAPEGTFSQVGHGSINDEGVVVFAALIDGDPSAGLFRWENGLTTTVARAGDPAPGGGAYDFVVTETLGFVDGTSIPGGPLADINNAGVIVFRGIASGSSTSRGIVRVENGVATWAVSAGEAAPGGGTFFDLQAASINQAGEIAFFADINLGGGSFTAGWYAGMPGTLRKALTFGDVFEGGTVDGLAFSRNPMQTIDDDGNVVVWCNVQLDAGPSRGRIVVVDTFGTPVIVAEQTDPAPTGGVIGGMDSFPSIESGVGVTVSAGTPGSPGGVISAHMLGLFCADDCPADFNGDGGVDGADLAEVLAAWGGSGPADLDGSGVVDAADLGALLGAWGPCD